ncbi:MAG: hypothetical protein KGK30_08505, partial [Elusimicrobia bacterium]|nr:hypothetical protein [Elusimicrobiota bacterium]
MFDRDALRRSAQWLAPAAVLLAALLLRVSGIRAVEAFQDRVFDAYQTLTPRRYDPGVPVRVVDIDDESLSRLGP